MIAAQRGRRSPRQRSIGRAVQRDVIGQRSRVVRPSLRERHAVVEPEQAGSTRRRQVLHEDLDVVHRVVHPLRAGRRPLGGELHEPLLGARHRSADPRELVAGEQDQRTARAEPGRGPRPRARPPRPTDDRGARAERIAARGREHRIGVSGATTATATPSLATYSGSSPSISQAPRTGRAASGTPAPSMVIATPRRLGELVQDARHAAARRVPQAVDVARREHRPHERR